MVLQRGKAVAHLGVQQRSRLYLHPEEATCVVWVWVGMPSRPIAAMFEQTEETVEILRCPSVCEASSGSTP